MKCEEAAEYVSALCDGERVPRAAAEHIGGCDACKQRLRNYVKAGVEMRRLASLDTEEAAPQVWKGRKRGLTASWWQKGWEAVRIPRFAFALLVVGVVGLGSGLAVEGVRAHATGSVVLLRIAADKGQPTVCALSVVDKSNSSCSVVSATIRYWIKVLSRDGDRVNLDVRAVSSPQPAGAGEEITPMADFDSLPEHRDSFSPGETLHVNVPGGGALTITGEWMDHLPVLGGQETNLDPGANELRVISPLLLRNDLVAGDMEGASTTAANSGQAVVVDLPKQGMFAFSESPMPGAVRGKVDLNRVTFVVSGQRWALIAGAPITRVSEVWVLYDPNFKPPQNLSRGFIAAVPADDVRTAFQAAK